MRSHGRCPSRMLLPLIVLAGAMGAAGCSGRVEALFRHAAGDHPAPVDAIEVERTRERRGPVAAGPARTPAEYDEADALDVTPPRDRGEGPEADADSEAAREREEQADAVARERGQYRQVLAKEIRSAERRVAELEKEVASARKGRQGNKEHALLTARRWRDQLERDLAELERVDEQGWPETRDRIDRDVEDDRPASVPRWLDRSIAI